MSAGAAGKKGRTIAFIFITFRMPVVQRIGFITAIVAGATGNYCAGYIHNQ
jgi:hypothetical protein